MTSSKLCPLLLLLPLLAAPAEQTLQLFEEVEPHMGTLVQIKLYASDGKRADAAARKAFDRIAELEAILSDYRPYSELNRLCRQAPGKPVRISSDLFRVLVASQALAAATDGAFDVTVGPLTHLWRQARRAGQVPDPGALRAALAHSGYRKLTLDAALQTAVLAEAGMQLDLGAIGKGYAADQAIAVLYGQHITSALVSVSGDLAFSDAPPGEPGWRIGIDSFRPDGTPCQIVLRLQNGAASTSGDSEQHLDRGAKRYSHILDPHTGQALTGSESATVIAAQGIDADAQATALCVLGPERGIRFIEESTKSAALIARQSPADVRMSKKFKRLLSRATIKPIS